MTKTRSTKRALLVSALALLTCVSMLVGSTFAWFTDSVTSAGNIIKSGTLDVTMEWADGTKAVPAEDSADWIDASTGAIFNYDKWEPGYTEVRHVKIANEGTLALKYQLSIQANGEVSKLADVIDVYYIDPAAQVGERTALTAEMKLGTLTEVLAAVDTTASGSLEAGKNHTITIALKMQETAGNEYQNLSIGTDFSVVLMATQKDFETDSFDEKYDIGLEPIEDGEVLVEENGIQYIYTPDGDAILYLVTEGYAESTVVVPEGIKTIGNYSFAYNTNVKEVILSSTITSLGRGFDSSTVEKVVLNEGLEQINSRAFRSTPKLQEVVISSTVKTIADNAFQKSGIKEIVIPATVETVGEAAFGASKIEKVTFEGNTSIQGYAFRGCPNLRTVVMNGDDVTFIRSTLNGRNSMWFCNGESNNPNTSNITFYVVNDTVAQRVKTAMGAEANNTKIYVNGKLTLSAANNAQLDAAIQEGASTVILGNGTYIIPDSAQGKTLKIVGNGNTVVATQDDGSYEGCDYSLDGATVTFEGVTINTDSRTYTGYARCKGTYNNCTINGAYTLYGESVFNNCTFNVTGDTYNIWTWGAKEVQFNDCTFNTDGKSILVYNQTCDVYVNGCTFNDRTNGTGFTKSALETGVDGVGPKYNIYITDTTVNGFAENDKCVGYANVVGNKNSMTNEYLNIVVDGVDVY